MDGREDGGGWGMGGMLVWALGAYIFSRWGLHNSLLRIGHACLYCLTLCWMQSSLLGE